MTPLILIVDDETFMQRIITASLKKGGFSTTACSSGEQALATAALQTPQLIIMDMMMPGVGGIETLRRMKQCETLRDVPVIMLTAKGNNLARIEAVASGAHVFLTKPFSPSHLLEEARRLLTINTTMP